jgi:pimeloyl-ACP methyl ester carboxylesterase
MNYLLAFAAIFIAIPVLLYVVSPAILYRQFQKAIRRKGRLVQKSVQVDGAAWPYLEGGPADGEVIVFVHGFGADKDSWSFAAHHFTDKYRMISPDLPGFGESDVSKERDYSIAAQTGRLIQFLDAMGIEKCHIAGNSMGGFIALQAALDHGHRLTTLTLVNNAGVTGANESELQKLVTEGQNPLVVRKPADIDQLMAFVAHKPRPIPGQFKKVMFNEAKGREALLDKIFLAIAQDSLENPVNDRLHEVKCPTLIIWGKHDRLIDVSAVDVLEARIKGSESVVFDHLAHVPMIEDPKAFADAHLSFLARAGR